MPDKRESVFGGEWRRCLREHYKYVIQQEDAATEETLTPILHQVGFGDDELQQLYVEATMHTDDVAEDFVPDMERAAGKSTAEKTFEVHPAECNCAACMDEVLEDGHDEDGQPVEEPDEPEEAEGNVFQVTKPDTAEGESEKVPEQKSMF